ncbi:F-box only protein 15 [Hippocampus zosterae]|uniref:F-box only protein 15 n=1 Tax=Hippocampus zosterae TaxID=109293 RepID=UPI00223DABC6|nr:F-box only protein 15 [Hippocampus zosterae]XP_051909852.1 F-box only protein 15 [Hippocampus zosterae]
MLALKSTRLQRVHKVPRASLESVIERLPYDIQNKILSYLDAGTLLCVSHVSKTFYQLANDEVLWRNICKRLLSKRPMSMVGEMLEKSTLEAGDQPWGYWKLRYFKALDAWNRRKWRKYNTVISRHTGLPSQAVQMLRNVTWELTVMDKSKNEVTYDLSWVRFFETSAVLCWNGTLWPDFHKISTIQLHGVSRVALSCPGLKAPGWRSLMDVVDMQSVTKSMQDYGQDQLVELKLLKPDVVMGLWREQRSVAFVTFTLHLYMLLERSTQGSSLSPYVERVLQAPFDDIDPDYGLHGYRLHIVLHSTECEIVSASFSQLFCRRDEICDGHIQLSAMNDSCFSKHAPLSGNVTLPWRCEALRGEVKNRCIMSLTLLDEFNRPFWCVSSPVALKHPEMPLSLFHAAEHFLVHYQDTEGQVVMKFVQMEEQKQIFLVGLVVYVTTCKVNKYFRKEY